jgi:hypothetical protein
VGEALKTEFVSMARLRGVNNIHGQMVGVAMMKEAAEQT